VYLIYVGEVMKKKSFPYFFWAFLCIILALYPRPAHTYTAKIAVFNFNALNLDARGYDATVTNTLIDFLQRTSSFNILNRKELESFLYLNDLQQNCDLSNVVTIGNRLGLDMIVAGTVKKNGPVIDIFCKVANIPQKSFVYIKKVRSFGNSGLREEIRRLSSNISKIITIKMDDAIKASSTKDRLAHPLKIVSRPGSSKIGLYWEGTPDSKSQGYKIFRSQSEEGPFVKIAQVTKNNYVDEGLEKNTAYYYRIKAFDTKGNESDFSATILAETALTPNPPIIINTEAHVKSIKILWSPNPTKSPDPEKLMGYKVYRSKTEEGPYAEIANLTEKDLGRGIESATDIEYLDRNLEDGEHYYFKVSASNEKNLESDLSSSMKGNCLPVVNGVVATGDMIRQLELRWTPTLSEHVKGYVIYRSMSPEKGFITITTIIGRETDSFIDTEDLEDKTTYYYRVSLFEDNEREGSMSHVVSATTKGRPPTPRRLKAKSGLARMVKLLWNMCIEEEVKGYKLYRSTAREGEYIPIKTIDNQNKNNYLDNGTKVALLSTFIRSGFLKDNTTYYYKVTSYNKVDVESKSSDIVYATTKPRPARPSGFGGESLHVKEIPLFWQPNPEDDIAQYHIFKSSGDEKDFSEIASVKGATSYVDRLLQDGREYRYKMTAEDKDGLKSNFSDTITIKTKPKPRAPTGLTAQVEQGKIVLIWSNNTESDITSYNIFEKGFLGPRKVNTVKEPQCSIVSPKPDKSKDYTVTAVDKDGLESKPSQPVTVIGK
jgi:fibronectin type 3 domain-containing protein/TolB-like protein